MIWRVLMACVSQPVELASIDEAPGHTKTKKMTFRAFADTSIRGRRVQQGQLQRYDVRSDVEVVVLPLFAPGANPNKDVIPAWVTHEAPHFRVDPLGAWYAQVEDTFDGEHEVTLKTLNHHPDAGWRQAIRDAERRHGVRSHPDAAVFVLPRAR